MSRSDAEDRNVAAERAVEPGETPTHAPLFRAWRAGVIALVLCGVFVGVIARAHHLQVDRSEVLSAEAAAQLESSMQIRARRGAILDRDGGDLAVSVSAESVFVRPAQVTDARRTASVLAPLLGRSELELHELLTQDRNFVWLARRISPQLAATIRAAELSGIDSMHEWQRYYPMRQRAGHLLGFTGDEGYGLEGVERALDGLLAGGAMEVRGLRDAHGRSVLATESPRLDAMEGASVVLTIDSRIQRIAERELERAMTDEQARTGVVIVMDPATGEILAMTNWPPFDPNRFRVEEPGNWRNRAVTDAWEPGSTMKVFTYAAALDAGVLSPDDVLDTGGGRVQIGRHRIRDHVREAELAAWQVIQVSSNIGAYRMGSLVGDQGLYDAFRRFGFGEPSGIGLGGEQAGILASPPWAEVELANRAFGQGINATPLQMAVAFSALANGGELMVPMLVREVRDKDGDVLQRREPRVRHRAVSERTARQVVAAMIRVTEDPGTGTQARLAGVVVAGKTGTAQKYNPELGAYDDRWMSSFIGFAPADDPAFTILVMIDEPQVGHYGGEVAGPVFARIAEQALAARGIYPSPDARDVEPPAAEQGAREPASAAPDPPPALALRALPIGYDGRPARVTMPDLTGRTLTEVLRLTESLGIEVEVTEWGVVEDQWPAPGASILQGSTIDVFMRAHYDLGQELTASGVSPDEAVELTP